MVRDAGENGIGTVTTLFRRRCHWFGVISSLSFYHHEQLNRRQHVTRVVVTKHENMPPSTLIVRLFHTPPWFHYRKVTRLLVSSFTSRHYPFVTLLLAMAVLVTTGGAISFVIYAIKDIKTYALRAICRHYYYDDITINVTLRHCCWSLSLLLVVNMALLVITPLRIIIILSILITLTLLSLHYATSLRHCHHRWAILAVYCYLPLLPLSLEIVRMAV